MLQKLSHFCDSTADIVSAYADDKAILIDTTEKVQRIKDTFKSFERVSEARLNYTIFGVLLAE
jgi:hypothetical protein